MKKIRKIIALALCIIISVASFGGCSKGDEIVDFIYPFGGDIVSFDPQIASTADEFLVMKDLSECLTTAPFRQESQQAGM